MMMYEKTMTAIHVMVVVLLTLFCVEKALQIRETILMDELLEYQAKNCEPMG